MIPFRKHPFAAPDAVCACSAVPVDGAVDPMSDAALVRRMQAGDMSAFDMLYTRYKDEVYRTACLITGNRMDGEDLAQEAFIRCAQAIGSLREGSKFRPWLMTTLTRAAWREGRKRRREQPVAEVFDDAAIGESALSAVLRTDERTRLHVAIRQLDKRQRTVIVLYYFHELPIAEIARTLGVREGTVKSRLHAARQTLRWAIEKV